ncbi:hypothetical protein [Pseudomonas sp. G5(2012)]|uniref:hypothetical protein n=1 Tax=Pseudomonas sp. G5(2012) TaxID=1268068 RepID=UPI0003431D65|nr:hypothetical protein [Pseudomonas sp. G5(2012)]EPA97881.1 hypothetical protein PG5_16100 [Pseudomonas sp. G5(2012)]
MLLYGTPELLDEVIQETQKILRCTVTGCSVPEKSQDSTSLQSIFAGCCGLAQCIAGYALQDLGVPVKPLATQSLEGYYQQGHAVLVCKVAEKADSRWHLIDATFGQFCGEAKYLDTPSPAFYLMQSAEGAGMTAALLERGHVSLTPERAALYLSAFCNGVAPLEKGLAMVFMQNPPQHPYHYRRDIGCDDYSRENLGRYGQLIDSSRLASRRSTQSQFKL